MAFDLSDILETPLPTELAQRSFERQRTSLLAGDAFEAGVGRRRLATRSLPDFINSQAGQGSFFSGATRRGSQRLVEDQAEAEARASLKTNQALVDFLNKQMMLTTGVPL